MSWQAERQLMWQRFHDQIQKEYKMKKVKANWLEKQESPREYCSLLQLLEHKQYIGFSPHDAPYNRYMVLSSGPLKGQAIRPSGRWGDPEFQKTAEGYYFIFDSAEELLEWMKG